VTPQAIEDFDRWNHRVQAVCGRFRTQPLEQPGFVGAIAHQCLGGLELAAIHVNAPSIVRERGNTDRGDERFYFLVMQRQGHMDVAHDGEQFVLAPGEIALLDAAQSFEMRPHGLIRQLSVHLPREALDRVLPSRARRFGKLRTETLNERLLHGMLQQIAEGELDAVADPMQGGALQQALISLLQPSLDEALPQVGRPLRRLAERVIDESLQQPPTPAQLAARLNVSLRQLYRQFEEDGDSICRYIQRQRLARAAAMLSGPAERMPSITTLAYTWGFADAAHFSRLFKRQYGISPRDYRAQRSGR